MKFRCGCAHLAQTVSIEGSWGKMPRLDRDLESRLRGLAPLWRLGPICARIDAVTAQEQIEQLIRTTELEREGLALASGLDVRRSAFLLGRLEGLTMALRLMARLEAIDGE